MVPGHDVARELRDAPEPMLEAVMAASGATLETWRVDAVHARPGAETSVAFDVVASGERLYLVATTAAIDDASRVAIGAVRVDSEAGAVTLWRHPADPALPGLAIASSARALESRVAAVRRRDARVEELQMLVLRPMRRAVLRATFRESGGPETWYVKVVRPDRAPALLARHEMCALAPAALDLGDGVVLVAAAPGVALTTRLYRPTAPPGARPVDPRVLLDALRSLPPDARDLDRRATPTQEVSRYAEAAVAAGLDADRVSAVVAEIIGGASGEPGPVVATHGDFHAANLFVSEDPAAVPVGLIDVDTLGPGYRADDLACMLAHLLTLHDLDPEGYADVPDLAERTRQVFAAEVDPRELSLRAAAVLLSLAAGIGDTRLAERWLSRAETEAGLRGSSTPPQVGRRSGPSAE